MGWGGGEKTLMSKLYNKVGGRSTVESQLFSFLFPSGDDVDLDPVVQAAADEEQSQAKAAALAKSKKGKKKKKEDNWYRKKLVCCFTTP